MLPRSGKWLLLTLSSLALASDQPSADSVQASVQKQGINWAPCPHPGVISLDCATLAVPLNYTAGASSETIDLQLTRVHAFKQPSKGSILFNPGGPGVAGRGYLRLRMAGLALMYMTGGEYDLVAFNPRGTGETMPFSCGLDTNETDVELDSPSSREVPNLAMQNLTDLLWNDLNQAGEQCSKAMGLHGELIGTTFVARDMMQIVDALGEDGMLRYWGMSYGTVLGATVAAMYPDRMDKIVLDGVVNLAEYWAGEPIEALMDTESVIDGFFSSCVQSPEYCELAGDGSSAAELRQKFDNLVQAIKAIPDGGKAFNELTSGVAEDIIVTGGWPNLALRLAATFKLVSKSKHEAILEIDQGLSPSVASETPASRAIYGIRCSDSRFRAHDLSEAASIMQKIEAVAPTLGNTIAPLVYDCGTWKMTAEERYTDPLRNIHTKNPILFVGNTHDPRTPLASARNASQVFPESALLTLDGYGHCSTSQPSLCIGKAVKAYFTNGTLPVGGTVCQPSVPPFRDPSYNINTVEALLWADPAADDDDALLAAWTHVGRELSLGHGPV